VDGDNLGVTAAAFKLAMLPFLLLAHFLHASTSL